MFVNLVRIQLIKITHSRYTQWSAAASFLVAAVLFVIIAIYGPSADFSTIDSFNNNGFKPADTQIFYSVTYLNALIQFANVIVIGTAITLACNHYEHREKININGIIRSPIMWYASELVALVLLTTILALIVTVLIYVISVIIGATELVELGLMNWVLAWIGVIINIIVVFTPILFIAKLFRARNPVITISISYLIVRFVALVTIAGMITGYLSLDRDDTMLIASESTQIGALINNPGNAVVNVAFGSPAGISVWLFVGLTVFRIVLWPILGIFASRRRNEV